MYIDSYLAMDREERLFFTDPTIEFKDEPEPACPRCGYADGFPCPGCGYDDEATRAEVVAKAAKERLRESHYFCEVCGQPHEEPCDGEEA